jgi:hypothetical protein
MAAARARRPLGQAFPPATVFPGPLRQARLHFRARAGSARAGGAPRAPSSPRSSGSASARGPPRARQSGSPSNKTAPAPAACPPSSSAASPCKRSPWGFPARPPSTVTVPLAASARSACAMASQLSPSITRIGEPHDAPGKSGPGGGRGRQDVRFNACSRCRAAPRRPERGQMARRLAAPASGQHCYQWTARGQPVFPKKLLAAQRWPHQPGQRMADVGGQFTPSRVKKSSSKGKMHSRRRKVRRIALRRPFRHAHACGATRYTTGTPCRWSLPRHSQVEIRRIRQNRQVGLSSRAAASSLRYSP